MDTLQRHMVRAVQMPETRRKLEEAGFSVVGFTLAEARKPVQDEAVRWAKVVKDSG